MDKLGKVLLISLSIVTMENGDGSVTKTVSGTMRGQYLYAHNWVTVHSVSYYQVRNIDSS